MSEASSSSSETNAVTGQPLSGTPSSLSTVSSDDCGEINAGIYNEDYWRSIETFLIHYGYGPTIVNTLRSQWHSEDFIKALLEYGRDVLVREEAMTECLCQVKGERDAMKDTLRRKAIVPSADFERVKCEKDGMEKRFGDLSSKLNMKTSQIDVLRSEIADLELRVQAECDIANQLRLEKNELEQAKQQITSQFDELNAKFRRLEGQLTSKQRGIQSKLEDLEAQVSAKETELAQEREKTASLNEKLAEQAVREEQLTARVIQLEDRLADSEEKTREMLSNSEAEHEKTASQEGKLAEQAARELQLTSRIAQLEGDLVSLQQKNRELLVKFEAALQTECVKTRSHSEKLAENAEREYQLTARIKQLEGEVACFQEKSREMLANFDTKQADSQRRLKTLEKSCSENEEVRQKLESEIKAREDEIGDLSTKVKRLSNDLQNAQSSIGELNKDHQLALQKLKARLDEECSKFVNLEAKYKEVKRQLGAKHCELRFEITKSERERVDLERTKENEVVELRAKLTDSIKREREGLDKLNTWVTFNYEPLKAQLEKANEKVGNLERKLEAKVGVDREIQVFIPEPDTPSSSNGKRRKLDSRPSSANSHVDHMFRDHMITITEQEKVQLNEAFRNMVILNKRLKEERHVLKRQADYLKQKFSESLLVFIEKMDDLERYITSHLRQLEKPVFHVQAERSFLRSLIRAVLDGKEYMDKQGKFDEQIMAIVVGDEQNDDEEIAEPMILATMNDVDHHNNNHHASEDNHIHILEKDEALYNMSDNPDNNCNDDEQMMVVHTDSGDEDRHSFRDDITDRSHHSSIPRSNFVDRRLPPRHFHTNFPFNFRGRARGRGGAFGQRGHFVAIRRPQQRRYGHWVASNIETEIKRWKEKNGVSGGSTSTAASSNNNGNTNNNNNNNERKTNYGDY